VNDYYSFPIYTDKLLKENLKIVKQHLIKWPYVICNDPNSEMHHIKHVKKILRKKKPDSFDAYLEAMRLINRKTLAVYKKHHQMINNDQYDRTSLQFLFKTFKEQGIGYNKKSKRY
jgi:hypothetical protein